MPLASSAEVLVPGIAVEAVADTMIEAFLRSLKLATSSYSTGFRYDLEFLSLID